MCFVFGVDRRDTAVPLSSVLVLSESPNRYSLLRITSFAFALLGHTSGHASRRRMASLNAIGIEDGLFMGTSPGFCGTIKRRPSDFVVR